MQPRQQHQIGPKAQQVGEQIGEGLPDGLDSVLVGRTGADGFFDGFVKAGVQDIGKGSPGHFIANAADDLQPDADAPIDGVFVQVRFDAVECKQHPGEGQNHPHQALQRGVGFHPGQHRRGQQQLGDGAPRRGNRDARAQKGDAFVHPPGHAQHEAHVLQGVVFGFFFHVFHLLPIPYHQKSPRAHSGDELQFWGDEPFTAGGSGSRW